jgi:hypothetical protein
VENYHSKLRKLSQTRLVQEYLHNFLSYTAPLNYNDKTLHDMFYEGLKPKIRETMVLQDFDPLDPNTTFEVLMDCVLQINQWLEAIEPSCKVVMQTQSGKSVSTLLTASPGSAWEKLTVGDAVFMIGSDGKAKKGKITAISGDNFGKVNPVVQWNGSSDKVRIPFSSLKKDSRPQSNPNPPTPKNDDKGPAPLDIDAKAVGKGKGKLVCNNCGGTGHFA